MMFYGSLLNFSMKINRLIRASFHKKCTKDLLLNIILNKLKLRLVL